MYAYYIYKTWGGTAERKSRVSFMFYYSYSRRFPLTVFTDEPHPYNTILYYAVGIQIIITMSKVGSRVLQHPVVRALRRIIITYVHTILTFFSFLKPTSRPYTVFVVELAVGVRTNRRLKRIFLFDLSF